MEISSQEANRKKGTKKRLRAKKKKSKKVISSKILPNGPAPNLQILFQTQTDMSIDKPQENEPKENVETSSEKSTECYFKEFGDFWPYMDKPTIPDEKEDNRFYFMLAFPQFLRSPNRLYLERLKKLYAKEEVRHRKQTIEQIDYDKFLKEEKARVFEAEFHEGDALIKSRYPRYYEYLRSHYIGKYSDPYRSRERTRGFEKAVILASKQNDTYLDEMERVLARFLDTYSDLSVGGGNKISIK